MPASTHGKDAAHPNADLRRKLIFYRLGFWLLLALWGFVVARDMRRWLQDNPDRLGWDRVEKSAPYHSQVAKIIRELRYSGRLSLLRPDVFLSVDPLKKTWTIHNLHRFGPGGEAILEEGRAGVCGQLAAYTFQKIQTLFDHRYSIRLVQAAESGYFPPPTDTHIVLRITDMSMPAKPKAYILDPSFRRYGPISDFEDYYFYSEMTYMDFMASRGPDETRPIGHTAPFLIRDQTLLSLGLKDLEGKFDADNHMLVISATRKHHYVSRMALAFRKKDGRPEDYLDEELLLKLLSREELDQLRGRLLKLFSEMRFGGRK